MTRTHRVIALVALIVLALSGAAGFFVWETGKRADLPPPEPPREITPLSPPPPIAATPEMRTVGTSVEGRPIELYSFGTGDYTLLFVGGIHGGYEWNSTLLAYSFIDHYTDDPNLIPSDTTIHIIPTLNPDGLYRVIEKVGRFTLADVPPDVETAPGRFNARGVDLNRNFDCKWQPKSTWRGNVVGAGTAAFSEPEAAALRDLVAELAPDGVVFWHSKANAVYASECTEGILPGTRLLMNTYARGAGYTAIDTFDAYPVTGDAEGWLASIGIPAITVELATYEDIEWEKNLAGVEAVTKQWIAR